jgi:hypothetical protein
MSRAQRTIASLLTVNALLLGGLLWVQIAERPIFARQAVAQPRNFPNAGAQRDRMIRLLDEINRTSAATKKLLEKGQIKVEVTKLPSKK